MDDDKARALRDHLMSPQMFSGWGIRTMAVGEGGYNPIEYHDGTVWPHDNHFIAAGLARYGFRKDAATIIAGIFEASWFFDARLPEVFSGYDRGNTRYPCSTPRPVSLRRGPPRRRCSASARCSAWNRRVMC